MKLKRTAGILLAAAVIAGACGCAPASYEYVVDQTVREEEGGADISWSYGEDGTVTVSPPGTLLADVRVNEGFPAEFAAYAKLTNDFVGDDVMPVSGWVTPSVTDENFAALAAAGINAVSPLGVTIEDREKFGSYLRLCEKYGIACYLHNDYATEYPSAEAMAELFAYALESPAFAGIAYDEPGLLYMKEVGLVHEYMNTFMSSKIFFVNNMGPGMAPISVSIGNTSGTHQQAAAKFNEKIYGNAFIDSFDGDYLYRLIEGQGYNSQNMGTEVCYQAAFDIMRMPLMSFDSYQMTEAFPYVGRDYYNVLSTGRSYAKKHNVPFWNYVQVIGLAENNRPMKREEILFQVNTDLSYGVKGINYFLYSWNSSGDGGWMLPMVDADGNKSVSWYNVAEANAQIAAADEVLLYSLHRGVIQCGWSPAEIPARDKLERYGKLLSADGPHAIIGCFDYDADRDGRFESQAFYVTNNSVQNAADTVLHFDGRQNVTVIAGGKTRTLSGADRLCLRQGAGDGALVVLEGQR